MASVNEREVHGIVRYFRDMPDPRSAINRLHLLVDVVIISVLGVIAGADGPEAIGKWAQLNQRWLKQYLRLPYGVPSHDTIGRVLEALNPQAFQQCFQAWLLSLCDSQPDESCDRHLAIDGKALRRSHDRRKGLGPLHLVSVWASASGISLGQLATEEKPNEITAIPQLLTQIDVAGAIVTIDAAGCQKNIAEQIVEGGGDYVLALKGNQPTLHETVQDWIEEHLEDDFARQPVSRYQEREISHGRQEHRTYYQIEAPPDLPGRGAWQGLRTIGWVVRVYEVNGEEHSDVRYYISSLKRSVKKFARAVRRHWGIENTLHWSLDMTFREDESRVRRRRAADNLAWLRRIALTLFKQHPGKESLVMKRRMAGWDRSFLMEVLTGTTH
jgi:predicted transposase YbfD/YdcC